MTDEIITVEDWDLIWCDTRNGHPSHYAPTGTNLEFMEQRYIQNVRGRQLHSLDLGLIETKWSTRWENTKSFTTVWKECLRCGKKFDLQEM
jgi:hypothetical protein